MNSNFKKRAHLLVLVSFYSLAAFAQHDTLIGSPPGYSYLQLRKLNDMTIDNLDNVWMAYDKIGLVQYSSTGWVVYDSLNSPLLKNKILSVAANAMGIWAGTDTGLFNFNG